MRLTSGYTRVTTSSELSDEFHDLIPENPGRMEVDETLGNTELRNFRLLHPDVPLVSIPITPALREKILSHLRYWRRMHSDDIAKVQSILEADRIPPPIVHFYDPRNVGIPDGFHRVAAYILAGRTSILGYALGEVPFSS